MAENNLSRRISGILNRLRPPALGDRGGFTLLEVIIAITIMVLAFASILSVESDSISATTRAKEMNIATMLARGKMIDLEYSVEGKTFDEVKKEDAGAFETPYESFHWKTEVKEVKFPNMNFGSSGGKSNKDEDAGNQFSDMIFKMVTNNLSKAIREMFVTISWKRGSNDVSYTVSTYWVDLNHEFQTSE